MSSLVEYLSNKNFTYIDLCSNYKPYFAKANPSVLIYNDTIFVNFRCINYIAYVSRNNKYTKPIEGWLSSKNIVSENYLGLVYENKLQKDTKNVNIKCDTKYKYAGLEDAILTQWNNHIYLCGTRCDIDGKGRYCIYKLNENFDISEETVIKDKSLNNIEKHWSPVEDEPFTFIRWCNPTEIIKVEPITGKIIYKKINDKSLYEGYYGGNCQTVKYKDGYLSIVHNTQRRINKFLETLPSYKHYFIQYDKDFNIVRISKPFNFEVNDIEFCCGLQINDGKVYISYSVYDSIPALIEFDKNLIEDIFEQDFGDSSNSFDLYKKGNELLQRNYFYGAASCYSRIFSNTVDKELEYESLMRFCICLLAIKYKNVNVFSNEIILSFIDNLLLLKTDKAEPYYMYSVYYGLIGDLNKKEIFKQQYEKYRFELPEIKKYLKIW